MVLIAGPTWHLSCFYSSIYNSVGNLYYIRILDRERVKSQTITFALAELEAAAKLRNVITTLFPLVFAVRNSYELNALAKL